MIGLDLNDLLAEWVRTHFFGKYGGKVADVDDPLQLGRIKVEVPGVFAPGDSAWALPCVPYAGDQIGFKFIPDVGANVWVEFEQGDIARPIWTGFWWGDGEMPSDAGSGADVKMIKTKTLTILIDDASGEMTVTAANGGKLTISGDVIADVNGMASVTVSSSSVTVEVAPKKIEVSASSVSINGGAMEVM